MVRLEKVTLRGFKSFAKKTALPLESGFAAICGPNGSGKCLLGDTKVIVNGKLIEVGKLVEEQLKKSDTTEMDDGILTRDNLEGLKILTMTPELKLKEVPISAFVKRESPRKLVEIKTRSGKKIVVTKYHPLFTIKDGEVFSPKAEEIQEGVKVATPRILPIHEESQDLRDFLSEDFYVPFSKELRGEVKEAINETGLTQKKFSEKAGLPYTAIRSFLDGQSIRLGNLRKILESDGHAKEDVRNLLENVKMKTGKKINVPHILDGELARYTGYLISEGRSSKTNQVWFTNSDENMIEDFCDLTNMFDLRPRVFNYKENSKDVLTFSKSLEVFLESVLNLKIGSTSREKEVPRLLFGSPKEVIAEFISALSDGDGYLNLDEHGEKIRAYFEYSSASKELAEGVQTLLLRLGINSILRCNTKKATNTPEKKERKYYSVFIYGKDLDNFLKTVDFKNKNKRIVANRILRKKIKRNPNLDLVPNVNVLFKKIVKESDINIKKSKGPCPKLQAYYENRCECSREGILEVLKFLEGGVRDNKLKKLMDKLRLFANSHLYWDEVVSVREVDSEDEWVYDLCVDGTHNFVANNVVVHNSNITDSICFVLGKLSAKSLRADKFKNLLFNGAEDRKPADSAFVTLHFDNKDGDFPVDDEKVSLTRKINKRGSSVYKLNGRTVTRQKVIDLLSGSRLSPDAYNVIMQGDVTRIIEMTPFERREIIDEISGIAEFDDKKKKAEKELAKVEEKVSESEIVVNEKKAFLDRMKEEKKAAEKHEKLSKDLKVCRASLYKKKLSDSESTMKELEEKIKNKEKAVRDMKKHVKKLDKEIDKKEKEISSMSDEALEKAKNADLVRKIEKISGEISRKRDRIESNQKSIDRLENMIARLEKMKGSDLGFSYPVKTILKQNRKGVYGAVSNLISVPSDYQQAVEVALGMHMQDVVVDTDSTASKAIDYLKKNKVGRVRFLPLNKIKGYDIRSNKEELSKEPGVVGFVIDLVDFDPKYDPVFKYMFRDTLVVEDLKAARNIGIGRNRMVTLDGDLCEKSGAMIGGYRVKKSRIKLKDESAEMQSNMQEKKLLEEENEKLEKEVEELEKELEKISGKSGGKVRDVYDLEQEKSKSEKDIEKSRKKRRDLEEKRLSEEERLSKLRVKKAKTESEKESNQESYQEFKGVKTVDKDIETLEKEIKKAQNELNLLGPVNMKAIEEYDEIKKKYEKLSDKLEKLVEERYSVLKIIVDIESKRKDAFMKTFKQIADNFNKIYSDLVGGEGVLELEEPENIESGLVIKGCPPGKKFLTLDALSGGEKTLTALAFLFAIQQHKPAPFYVLDEVDAALDKANTKKIGNLIKKYSDNAQFIVITHNDATISMADNVYGISMDRGVSNVVGIDMPNN